MSQTQIIDSRILTSDPQKYIGWPTVTTAPNGVMYAVYSGDRDAHVCPFGKVLLMRSEDQGLTWSEPEVVVDTPLDDRDAGICACPDGTLVLSWFTSHFGDYAWQYKVEYIRCYPEAENRWPVWEEKLKEVTPEVIARWAPSYESPSEGDYLKRWMGFWTIRSTDGGRTWDEPCLSPVYAPHGPTVLDNGDLLYVGMRHLARVQGENTIGVARSSDQGRTWIFLSSVSGFPPYHGKVDGGFARLGEPHVVEAESGKLVGMARYEETKHPEHPYQSHLWQFDSFDGGKSWTTPRETEIIGKPPFLSRARNGDLLVSYGFRHQPFSQKVCISHDEGKTWDLKNEVVLEHAPLGDLGYVSTTEYAPGQFFSLYYQKVNKNEKTALGGTRWRRV